MLTPRLAVISMLFACSARAQDAKLKVIVDPRVEMLSAALMQSAWPEGHSGFLSPYARDMQQAFFPHRQHPFIHKLNALKDKATLAKLVERALGTESASGPVPLAAVTSSLDSLPKDLAAFGADTKFAEFFASRQLVYDELTASYTSLLPPISRLELLETYYGSPTRKYIQIIAPTLKTSNASLGFMLPGTERTYVSVVSPDGLQSGKLTFDPDHARDSLFSQFGNILLAEAAGGRSSPPIEHAGWWPYMKEKAATHGIPTWESEVLSSISSAVTIRLWQLGSSPADALRHKREQMVNGFALLPFFQERLAEYENSRDKYRSLGDYLPRLLSIMDEMEPILSGTGEAIDLGLADVWLTDAGVPVKSVAPGSLAAKAGILKGDTIQSIASIRVNGSESDLKAWKQWEMSKHGEAVSFRILRQGNLITIPVTMKRNVTFEGFRKRSRL